MSQTLWCDIDDPATNTPNQSGHSFTVTDPDYQHFTKTQNVKVQTGNSYGTPTYQDRQQVTTELDICGYHWRKQNPFLSANSEIDTHSLTKG